MKTLRFHLPVLDAADADVLLDLVTRIDGVVAALVAREDARVDVLVASRASALLVREQVRSAMLAAAPSTR